MKASTTSIVIALAAMIPLGAAMAGDEYGNQTGKAAKPASFDTLDTNHDGRISQAEAAVDSKLVFSTADANGDGYLSKAEWQASMKGSASPAPQSAPATPADPGMPQATGPSSTPQPDTETPRR